MNKRYFSILTVLLFAISLRAQTAADYAVQLNAVTQVSPPQIKLQWKKLSGFGSYTIDRKGKEESGWSNMATLDSTKTEYTDAAVIVDSAYEYKVTRSGGVTTARGYIYAGIKAPAIHGRGTLILLADTTFKDSCKAEIAQLMADLRGDGWAVVRHDIGRSASVTAVRNIIMADYVSRPNVSALLLLGHIPVPYSGDLNPDGHPDHLGAWPTDAFYADMNGVWTDNTVNDVSASRSQNRNIPGDGKWDQTVLPSATELQTGRIDFANMPGIKRTEVQLMRNYLAKAHSYKMDLLPILRKGIVDDNFGGFSGEAFAANAWRLFPTMLGRANIATGDYITTLKDSAYQWSYGCGGGSYTSAGGIGVTAQFDTNAVKGIFSMMFGSYFGDWDAQNNFLRAPLCAPEPALTSCWAGRPNWFLHHMALGESIGYGTQLTQNNNIALYSPTNYGAHWVHVALMGDPTLRADYIRQPQNLAITPVSAAGANLSWTASPDAGVIGYYVYRSDSTWGIYDKISGLLTATAFTDNKGVNGKKYYLVRPVELQQSPSGAYYNLGIGIVDSATVTYPLGVAATTSNYGVAIFPNPATGRLNALVEGIGNQRATISILNASGSIVSASSYTLHAGENTFSWDVSGWPAGMYTLILRTGDGTTAKKWVKLDVQ